MQKILKIVLFALILTPVFANAALVTCQGTADDPCTISHFVVMFQRIYDFFIRDIATPLAVLAITIGAILLLISAGNPNLASRGKNILWLAIIGLALAYGSLAIVNFILSAMGFRGL